MNDLTSALAEHPFVTAEHLAAILGVGERHTRRLLAPLVREGVAGVVAPHFPGLRRLRLYYLRAGLDGTRALSPRSAARYLYQAGTLHGLRDRLAQLPPAFTWEELYPADEGDEPRRTAPLSRRFVSPRGEGTWGRKGLIFHALVRMGGEPTLVVEWDTGLLPRSLFWFRLERLLTVAPALLVFTQAVWLDAVLRAFSHARIPAAVAPVTDATQRVGEVEVWTGRGSRETFLSWVSALSPHRGREYPRRRLYFAGGWDEETRRFLALSPQEKAVLSLIVGLPLISPLQVADLAGMQPGRAVRVLRALERAGWVTAEDGRYFPTPAGLSLMARVAGSTPQGYARARHYRLFRAGDAWQLDVPALRNAPEHTLEERYLAATLAQQLGPRWTWYDEREAVIPFYHYGSWRLFPDALIVGDEIDVFLEVDRLTAKRRVHEKLRRYYLYRRSGARPFLLLALAELPHRPRVWLDAAEEIARVQREQRLGLLAATLEDVRRKGVQGRVWMGYDYRPNFLHEALRG